MPVLPINLGPAYGAWGSFRPKGKVQVFAGRRTNPFSEVDAPYAARLFIGFNVGRRKVHTLRGLMARVKRLRTIHPEATFVGQHGIYASVKRPGEVVTEEGAQVFIINTYGASPEQFRAEMMTLAETLCREMQQEAIIVEIQRGGVTERTYCVTP